MTIITDGTGAGYRAAVTSENRIKADVISEDAYVHAAEEGFAFNINTEATQYTGSGSREEGCIYIKNNGTSDLEMVGWFIGELNDRTGGDTTKPILFTMYGNPTGNIGGNTIAIVNRRIGAAKQFDIEALAEPTGWTASGTPLLYQYHYGSRGFGNVNFTIPPGQSIIVTATVHADSQTFYTGFTGYERT